MTDQGRRLTAALAERYRLERELGQGGMATVFLAQDLKHDRKVAIKVLRPELAAVIGGERFLSEIRTTANLQHPHILPLFDSGSADGFLFYVMPFIEGETLRDRLQREKQLPIGDAIRLATEIASALDYAHRHNIIHRDIKPANILLHDGRALVADFGIALAASKAGGTRMTETGMSLGTPQYMSPEQAMGEREITARSDVYALGCVVYEMLTGDPPFSGSTAQAVVARVVTERPRSLTPQRHSIPPSVEIAVLTALEKLPADRYASAAEFAGALTSPSGDHHPSWRGPAAGGRPRRTALLIGLGLVGLALAAGWLTRGWLGKAGAPPPVRFAFAMGRPGVDRPFLALSTDGREIVQTAEDSTGVVHLVKRNLASTDVITIAGTEGARDPSFSPDGLWIAFVADGKLKKVPADGGPAIDIADSAGNGAAAWTPDGRIIFRRNKSGLWRVPVAGGEPERLTQLDSARGEFAHWYPQMLPGGRAVIYTSYATPVSRSRIEAYDLGSGRRTTLVAGAVFARYAASGHLLYARDGAVWAIGFDPDHLRVHGTAVPVQADVAAQPTDGYAGFDVAPNGTFAFLRASDWFVDRRVVWLDHAGREEPVPAIPRAGTFAEPRLSPDGRWIAITVTSPKHEIWLYERARSVLTQLSHAPAAAFNAVWTPDSRSVIYCYEDPMFDLHRLTIDASVPDREVVTSYFDKFASSVSPDGRQVALTEDTHTDRILIAPLDGSAPPKLLGEVGVSQRLAVFSPDGRWIAYEQETSGRNNVYLRSASGAGGPRPVSGDGGTEPRWTRGGREIVYRRGELMMAAPVAPATGEVGSPTVLFRVPSLIRLGGSRTHSYDVTPDGSRFLIVKPVERAGVQPTVVVLNWFSELQRKVRR